MFKNQYDRDVTTWSPTGRLFQVEYANEAVNNGSAAVGVKNKEYVVIAALKRSPTAELSSYQEKVFVLDENMGMSITGLVADGRVLARFIRTECMNYRYMHDSDLPLARLMDTLAEKHQRHTQSGGKRPFGVGLLIGGYDSTGPRLFQTAPSGDILEYKATAMGLRSQAARTYLEKHCDELRNTSLSELVTHALRALSCATSEGVDLNIKNTTIAIVGKDTPFTVYTEEAARQYLDGFTRRAEDAAPALEVDDEEFHEQPLDVDE